MTNSALNQLIISSINIDKRHEDDQSNNRVIDSSIDLFHRLTKMNRLIRPLKLLIK